MSTTLFSTSRLLLAPRLITNRACPKPKPNLKVYLSFCTKSMKLAKCIGSKTFTANLILNNLSAQDFHLLPLTLNAKVLFRCKTWSGSLTWLSVPRTEIETFLCFGNAYSKARPMHKLRTKMLCKICRLLQ